MTKDAVLECVEDDSKNKENTLNVEINVEILLQKDKSPPPKRKR